VDGSKHVLVALNDVTDRKRAEEELKETMEMKSQFISHDLARAPHPMTVGERSWWSSSGRNRRQAQSKIRSGSWRSPNGTSIAWPA